MASTSTGFNKSLVLRRMPSSSGQTEEFSSGCKLNMKVNSEIEMESGSTFNLESGSVLNVAGKMQINSGGEVELESGSTVNVESGGVIKVLAGGKVNFFTTGALLLEKVVIATTTQSMPLKLPYTGFSYLHSYSTKTASNSTKFRIHMRMPPMAGITKTILLRNTTKIIEICASSSKKVEFATSGGKDYSVVLALTSKQKDCGIQLNMISLSTVLWHVGVGETPVAKSTLFLNTGSVTLTSSTCKKAA